MNPIYIREQIPSHIEKMALGLTGLLMFGARHPTIATAA